MGHPKKQRKKYRRPKKPYDKARINIEKALMKEFGLKRKKEIWIAESILGNFKRRARELLAKADERKQQQLFDRLNRIGLKCEKLDDVLDIKLEDILSRRLQTVVYKKGLANSIKQARQLITQKHVLIDDRKISKPSYLVSIAEEDKIDLNPKIKDKIKSASPT